VISDVMPVQEDENELYGKMFSAWKAGEHAYALEISRDLLRRFPDYEIGWLLQGVVLYELARYDESQKTLRRALQIIPDQVLDHGYVHLGHLCKNRGEYEDAERNYRKAIELAPDNAGRYVFLGALLATKGEFGASEKVHRDGTRCLQGRIDEAYLNLGYVLRAQERYKEALECFNKALELTPDYDRALTAKRDMAKVIEYLSDQA
jgi:tetratricopeptide (TPR) repeat protein